MVERLVDFFTLFSTKLRLSNPWRFKVPVLITVPYIVLLRYNISYYQTYCFIGLSLCTILGIACFGYLTNDLADRDQDFLAGKPNGTHGLGKVTVTLIGLLALLFALAPWYFFPKTSWSLVMLLSELLLFVFYAFPPFRFKEIPFLGAITDALYAHALPAVFAGYTFLLVTGNKLADAFWLLVSLGAWQFVLGIRNISFHHLSDHENDVASMTKTLTTQFGKSRIVALVKWILLPVEVLLFVWFISRLNWNIWLTMAIDGVFVIRAILRFLQTQNGRDYRSIAYYYLDDFYIKWLPSIILVALVVKSIAMVPLLILHTILFPSVIRNLSVKLYHFVVLKFNFVFDKLSSSKPSIQKGLRQVLVDVVLPEKVPNVKRIVIASVNRKKYSETFIHSHFNGLKGEVIILFDGYLPRQYEVLSSGKNGLLCHEKEETFSNSQNRIELQQRISTFLKINKVDVVLAEYGAGGAEMMEPCKLADVPFITHFHGFDAFRKDVLSHYRQEYPLMFKHAKFVVAVSEPMQLQLIKLGCPPNKVHLIPYGIDFKKFTANGEVVAKTVVSCGRFVEKKAPDLLIRSFAKVFEKDTDTRFTMIGDGELLEDCKSLANKLGVGSRINFTGSLAPQEVLMHLQRSAVFVQHSVTTPSGDSEGLPLSIMEARSCGLPVVATRQAGIPTMVVDGKTGFLVEERDIISMSERIVELIHNPQLAKQFGVQGATLVRENHSLSGYLKELQELIEQARSDK